MENTSKAKQDTVSIYEIVQAQLLEKLENALETGEQFTWVKPWTGAPYPCSYKHPSQPFTSAVNYLLLETGEYLTFNMIQELRKTNPDVKIRKGAKQAYVYQSFPVLRKDETGKTVLDEEGEPVIESFRLRYIREFHISDIENVRSHFVPREYCHVETEKTILADQVIQNYANANGIEVEELYGAGGAYFQDKRVVFPSKKQYESVYEYYSTVFHELGHSTRLFQDRKSLSYAQEELVGEITASFLCVALGLADDRSTENNIAYLQGWYGKIKDAKPKDLYFAIADAKKAADLILKASPQIRDRLTPKLLDDDTLNKQEKKEERREKKQRCGKK